MTTQQVIQALLANGWRWERITDVCAPVLTNAPEGMRLCTDCGEWRSLDDFSERDPQGICRECGKVRSLAIMRAHRERVRRHG